MSRLVLLLLFACVATPALPAQDAQPTKPTTPAAPVPAADTGAHAGAHAGATVVSGFVLDSLTNQPLPNATVIIAGTTANATTDAGGRFRFELAEAKEGVYTVGFFDPLLDSLGITMPARHVLVKPGSSTFVELAVPSANTIIHVVCPDIDQTPEHGLVMGVVRDAATSAPMDSARVVVTWTGLSIGNTAVLKVPRATSVVTDQTGAYRVCGVPSTGTIATQARSKSGSSGWVVVPVPPSGLALRDFLLGERPAPSVAAATPAASDSGGKPAAPAPLGTAVLSGTVTTRAGKPLEGAVVVVLGTPLTTRTNYKGEFHLAGLPSGTQSIEVRQVGFSPRRYAVDLYPNKESHLATELIEHTVVLNEIEVAAKKTSGIPGFDQRRKTGMGSYLDESDIEKRQPIATTDIFRSLPGVQVTWDGQGYDVQMTRNMSSGSACPVQWYVDGAQFISTGGDIDNILQPSDIQAIEVYRDAAETPMQFQSPGNSSCGTIVVWTKRGGKRPTN